MKIAAINGSPKAAGISSLIIKQMERLLGEQIEKYHAIQVIRADTSKEIIQGILEADILLIVFPLYIDSIPAPLIELLTRLEREACHSAAIPQVFAITNGAFDATQTTLALEMIEHFTCCAGLSWGYGIGIGAGSMLYSAGDNWEKGLASGIHGALLNLAAAIKEKKPGSNIYITPNFPRFLYRAIGNFSFWLQAKRNGVSNLRAQPYGIK